MRCYKQIICNIYTVFFILSTLTAQQPSFLVDELDAYIEKARLQWETPGLSVAVVHKGAVLLAKGFGEVEVGKGTKVDANTIFSVGSTTKAMVAASMAMLIDEGKLQWDDLVIDHLPDFRLSDPYVTSALKVRDLFTHNSGLGNTDLTWVLWDYSTEEIVERLRYEDLSYGFRGGYTYQNIMYATAGLLIEKLSGLPWNEFVTRRIFKPLGMTRTFALRSLAFEDENRSVPHYKWEGAVQPITDSNADSIGAAGSVWSCANDMAKWMNFVLDSARVNGERLISETGFRELHRPHIVIPRERFYPTASLTRPSWTTYSLGWFQHDYHGRYVQFHTGSLNGTVAIIGLIPSEELGVYVFGNLDHAEIRHAIMYKVFDTFTGEPSVDWSTAFHGLYKGFDRDDEDARKALEAARVKGTKPSLSLEKYTGTYSNKFLGKINVSKMGEDQLQIYFRSDRQMILTHWHYDTFMGTIIQYPFSEGSLMSFFMDPVGRIHMTLFGRDFTKEE